MSEAPAQHHEYTGHPGLQWLRASESGRLWLSALPRLVDDCSRRWSLSAGDPFPYAFTSLVLPAELADGTRAVLKLQFPGRESEHEAAALALWHGEGATRLLAADPERRALLLERCLPGTPLTEIGEANALAVMGALLPRLWVRAGPPFRPLREEAAHWATSLPKSWERAGRPFEPDLLELALELLGSLAGSQGDQVLVHQDLHAGNVLRSRREPWLVIDPKPLVGERELSIAPIVRGSELGHSSDGVRRRLHALVRELGLDRERARGWTIAQSLAWAFDGDEVLDRNVDVARWLAEA